MGMAASQARLLCLTARIHDVEQEAQSLQNAKLQLATQQDQVYNEYVAALDATTLTMTSMDIKSGEKSTITASFNSVFSHNRAMAADGNEYALFNEKGRLVVEDAIYDAYQEYTSSSNPKDGRAFAMYMLGGDNGQGFGTSATSDYGEAIKEVEENVYNSCKTENEKLNEYHELITELTGNENIYDTSSIQEDKEKMEQYEALMHQYKTYLYNKYAGDIYSEGTGSKVEDFNEELFNYYVSIYNQIEEAGGCVSIDIYNGPNGDAANNSEWLQAMVQCGKFSIKTVNSNDKTGDIEFSGTSPSSDISISYTKTSDVDNTALKKAEAKYDHALDEINRKEKKFDLSLSKLETERQALTTEYDSVKKVIEDNIDRTFGIFS